MNTNRRINPSAKSHFKTFVVKLSSSLIAFAISFVFSSNLQSQTDYRRDSLILHYYTEGWRAIDERRHPQAIPYLKKGKKRAYSFDPPDYDWVAEFNHVLGEVYDQLGLFRENLTVYYENLEIANYIENEDRVVEIRSIVYSTIAAALARMGLYESAIPYFYKSDYVDQKYFPEKLYYHYSNHRNLAVVYLNLKQAENAEYYLTKAKDILNQYEPFDPSMRFSIKNNFISLNFLKGDLEKVTVLLKASQKLLEEYGEFYHPELHLLWHQNNIEWHVRKGDTTDAINAIKNATEKILSLQWDPRYMGCRIYNSSADFLIRLGLFEKAKKYLNRCLELHLADEGLPPDQINEIGQVLNSRTLMTKATIYEALEKSAEEKTSALEWAVEYTEESIILLRHFTSGVLIPHSKNRLVREHMNIFEFGLLALYHLYKVTEEPEYLKKALFLADQSRAIILLEDLLRGFSTDATLEELMLQDIRLKEEYDELSLNYHLLSNGDDSELVELRNSMASIQVERENIYSRMMAFQPEFQQQLLAAENPKECTMQKIMELDFCILTHFPGSDILFTLGMSNKGMVFHKNEIPEEFSAITFSLRNEIERFPEVLGKREEYAAHIAAMESTASKLYDLLISPVEQILTGHLLIIPVDEISAIPFAALMRRGTGNEERTYLIEEQNILYSYSLKILEIIRSKEQEYSGTGLVFAPEYHHQKLTSFGLEGDITLNPLHFNQIEASFLVDNFGARSFIGREATKQNFLSNANAAPWLHISAHSFIHDQLPDYSFLAFTEGENGEDPLLPIIELEKINLRAGLVFLNGCWTGYGPIQKGEGMHSLQRAFAASGVNSLITTLWPVNDESAWLITKAFYEDARKQPFLPASIRNASLKLLRSGDPVLSHPYHWAGYMTYGNWNTPLYSGSRGSYLYWLLGLGVVVVFWYLRR